MSDPENVHFTYETKKLLWKNMKNIMRQNSRTNSVNRLIDNIIPYKLDHFMSVFGENNSSMREVSPASYFVSISEYENEGNRQEIRWSIYEFFENRVVVKIRHSLKPSADDRPGNEYNAVGSPQELMSQFLSFTLGRPGTRIHLLSFYDYLRVEITNTLVVENLGFLSADLPNHTDLALLDNIRRPLPHLHLRSDDILTKLGNHDLIQTAQEVQIHNVNSHSKLFMFQSPKIVVKSRFESYQLTQESEIFAWINGYSQQDRPIGHYFQMKTGRRTAEFIISSLNYFHAENGWLSKTLNKRYCSTLPRYDLEVTAYYKLTKNPSEVQLFVEYSDLETAKSREETIKGVEFSWEEIDVILKYMDFNKKMKLSTENPDYSEFFLKSSGFFIDELMVDCETADEPMFYVEGVLVKYFDFNQIFKGNSTIRQLNIKGIWNPVMDAFQPCTALNITLECTEVYPASFYEFFQPPERRVGHLTVKSMKVLANAGEFTNGYTVAIDANMEDLEHDHRY